MHSRFICFIFVINDIYAFSISHIEFLHSKTRVSLSGQQHKCCSVCPILTVAPFRYTTQLCSAQPGIWAVLCQLTSPQQVSEMLICTYSLYYTVFFSSNVKWDTYICDTACFSCSHVSSGHSSVSALCTTSSLAVSSVGCTHRHKHMHTSLFTTSICICPQYTSVDNVNSLAPSSMAFSSPPVPALSSSSVGSSMSGSNSLHMSGALGHGTNGSTLSMVRTAQLLSSSSGLSLNHNQASQ